MSETPTRYQHYTPGRPGPEEPARPVPVRRRRADCLVVASVVCVVIWATSGFGYFWPIWVLLPTFLPGILHGLRSRGR